MAVSCAVAAPPQAAQWHNFSAVEPLKVGGFGDTECLDSSDEDAVIQLPFPDVQDQPPSEEASRQLIENNRKLRMMQKRQEQRKRNFQNLLKAYQKKEMEFVSQMDSHMDEVEKTEHALSVKIEALSAENHQLRTFNEKRERDNSQLADRLGETTKQCSDSETRVQFLLDRIVALLSNGSAEQSQTEAVINMRQREREMLKQLEETRQQFDEVRQQNGELHSRLTEELSLSRRLQEQLVEVEERFQLLQQQREYGGMPVQLPDTGTGLLSSGLGAAALQSGLSSAGGIGEVCLPPRTGRLGPRPMGLRSDQTEALPDRERQPLPELPPPISEVCEALDPSQLDGQCSKTLNPVPEAELPQGSEEELGSTRQLHDFAESGDVPDLTPDMDGGNRQDLGTPAGLVSSTHEQRRVGEDTGFLTRVQQGARNLPTIWPSSSRHSPRPKPVAREKPQYSRTISSDGVLLMERKLREALDRASFECAVVRIENGIYNFGPNIRAVVDLSPEDEVIACLQDEGDWTPIDEFIRSIALRPSPHQILGPPSAASAAPPLSYPSGGGVAKESSGEQQNERRFLGPPAKTVQPYAGSPQPLGTPVAIGSGPGAVSSASPRRVAPANPLQPSVSLGRANQPSPPPGYASGQAFTSGAAVGTHSAGVSNQRMLIAPNAGGVRYGVAVQPGRQVHGSSVYPQVSSPR